MCFGGGKKKAYAPDTSAQEAEAARQRQAEFDFEKEKFAAEQARWEQEKADAQRRYDEQQARQQAEIDRQAKIAQDREDQATAEARQAVIDEHARAGRARVYTALRQQQMDDALAAIKSSFSGIDSAASDYQNSLVAAEQPMIERDIAGEKRKTKFKLADKNNLNSTAAGGAFADIEADRVNRLSKVAAEAAAKARTYRTGLEGQKNSAIGALAQASTLAVPDFMSDDDVQLQLSNFGRTLSGITSLVQGGRF